MVFAKGLKSWQDLNIRVLARRLLSRYVSKNMERGRTTVRVTTALRVVIYTPEGEVTCLTKNISQGGVFVQTDHPFKEGDAYPLRLQHLFVDFELKAEVRHVQTDGVGFQFVETDLGARKRLMFLVNDLLSRGDPVDDQRGTPRADVESTIVWRIGAVQYESLLKDLSPTGAFILMNDPPAVESRICLYVPAYDKARGERQALGCDAEVVRRDNDGFAVHFLEPDEGFLAAVRKVLVEHDDTPVPDD